MIYQNVWVRDMCMELYHFVIIGDYEIIQVLRIRSVG